MIHLSEDFRALESLLDDPRYMELPRSQRCNMTPDVMGAAWEMELRHRGRVDGAARLVIQRGGESLPAQLDRRQVYALCPLGSEVDAAVQMATRIASKYGEGDWWTVGCEPIDYSMGDGRLLCGSIDGITHVMLRCYFYHDPRRVAA